MSLSFHLPQEHGQGHHFSYCSRLGGIKFAETVFCGIIKALITLFANAMDEPRELQYLQWAASFS